MLSLSSEKQETDFFWSDYEQIHLSQSLSSDLLGPAFKSQDVESHSEVDRTWHMWEKFLCTVCLFF